ncbi:hypothetical protein KAI56_01010 [Candidatus Parcubacteria bacterium]|nr:hypothetical protein [Candidatus Parcubacteria bacterium]
MKNSFIKDNKLLMETPKVRDLFDLEEQINSFSSLLDSIDKSGSFGFVGGFGTGKSTLIENVKQKRIEKKKNEVWVEFDAWKFPDRKDLWEGFVLEFARQINKEVFEEAYKEIDGKSKDDMKALINVVSKGANMFLPGAGIIKNFSNFFKTSPARRVFEIQEILEKIIKKQKKDIFIIIEDIDRSGDSGIFFLETLKQFFDNIDSGNKLVAIVPIANDKFETEKDSFLKCLNFIEYFNFSNIKLDNFVEEIFEKEFIQDPNKKSQVVSFLETTFGEYNDMTPRLLKFILRKANFNFKRQVDDELEPDFRTTIIFEFSKYLKETEGGNFYFDIFKKDNMVTNGNIFSKSLFMILEGEIGLYRTINFEGNKEAISDSDINFQFAKRDIRYPTFPSKDWFIDNRRIKNKDGCYGLCDFYLKY